MKKIFGLFISAMLVLLMVSCGSEKGTREYKDITMVDDNNRNYYEIFVGSFYDSDSDGLGDINGVTTKLDYIKDLGFNGIWLMPITTGASYHKYDVVDYMNVDSNFGTLDDFKNLLAKAHEKGIDIIIDLVVNHTSSRHPWFTEACSFIQRYGEPGGTYGKYYNFKQEASTGYSKVTGTSFYYECRFDGGMPDLNLDSEKVRDEIKNIMKFWLDLGCDGFRLDAVTSYYTGDINKNIEFLSWLNTEAKTIKKDAYIVGEAWVNNDNEIRQYYNSNIDSFFQFTLSSGEGGVAKVVSDSNTQRGKTFNSLMKQIDNTYNIGILAPFLSNHDMNRIVNFVGSSNFAKVKFVQGVLSLFKGNPFVYYGEEIGMVSQASDPNRRLPIRWSSTDKTGTVTTLPTGGSISSNTYKFGSVEDNLKDPDSILNYYKYSNYIRNANPEISRSNAKFFESYTTENVNISVFQKTWNGKTITIVVNFNEENSQTVKLDKSELGFTEMTHYLCATVTDIVKYNDSKSEVTLAPYSIAVFR